MATAKTAPFVLSETLQIPTDGAIVTNSLDLGSYVNVGSKTGIAITDVDVVYQVYDSLNNLVVQPEALATSQFWATAQLFDQVRDTIMISNDNSLIGSGTLDYAGYQTSRNNDVYPDSYPTPGRISISPALSLVGTCKTQAGAFNANHTLFMTIRVTCKLVKMSEKDFMGIAIQGQALSS